MTDLLEYIVKNLVSKPEEVKISEETDKSHVAFQLTIDPEDMGIVIGKSGQTIRAIRRLLVTRALAEDPNLQVQVNLVEKQ